MDLSLSEEALKEAYKNNPEYIKLQQHNENELLLMKEWRNNHPFEEKVRKALKSKNGNDVAAVIKMVLENSECTI